MERFICAGGSDNLQIPRELAQAFAIDSPDKLHLDARLIASVARKMETGGWVRLPFCNTLCSEALGAKPVLDISGARVKEPPYQKMDELPDVLDLNAPRLAAMLGAVESLAGEGKRIAYNIEGPFTVLCALLPMSRVFSALRKPAGADMLQMAEDWVSAYAALAVDKGAKLLSFADPVATVDILGERMFTTVYVPCLKRLLRRLRDEYPAVSIHLCGKLTQCLLDAGECTAEKRQDESCQTYGQALSAFCENERGGVIGHFCLNYLDAKRPYITRIEF